MPVDTLPSPAALLQEIPLSLSAEKNVYSYRETIKNILHRTDPRALLIIGPCSIHDLESTNAYAELFQKLAEEVSDLFFLVMRTYFEKPRTIKGWKGFLHDPYLDGSHEVETGLRWGRKLLVDLAEQGIPTGSELLEIHTSPYLSDLLSWGCIGARTCASQPHRQLAASLPFPLGFKNSTDGNIDNAIHGILAATSSHYFLGIHPSGRLAQLYTEGNPDCHIILRGGERNPNYDSASVAQTVQRCDMFGVKPAIIIDCSHDNCNKQYERQIPVFQSAIEQMANGNTSIIGAMLESHLYEGNQPISSSPHYGISVTDPCLGWESTEELVHWAYQKLQNLVDSGEKFSPESTRCPC